MAGSIARNISLVAAAILLGAAILLDAISQDLDISLAFAAVFR